MRSHKYHSDDAAPRLVWPFVFLPFMLISLCGCTSVREFVANGFKVGPAYRKPAAPIAADWIEAGNPRLRNDAPNYADWWSAFEDPILNSLVHTAYEQNYTLRIAAARVLEARAARAIAAGTLFPQSQTLNGAVDRVQASRNVANPPPKRHFDNWATNAAVSWEIDFWGKIRRNIESATDLVDASVDDYDNVMVTLVSDVAASYVQYRIFQQQIAYTLANIELQRGSLKIATEQWKAGKANELGVVQGTSLLRQLEATVPLLEIGLRQSNNQLCVLLGMPPTQLAGMLGRRPIDGKNAEPSRIPVSPPDIVAGIPADLIRRRPDLRSAERVVAAQNAQIGVAESNAYPAFFITGSIGYQAKDLSQLVTPGSLTGQVGPGFSWNILNYGRILNNVRFQEYKTQELVAVYQQKVLSAAREVENGIILFLNARKEVESLRESVTAARRAVDIAIARFESGAGDFTTVFVAQQFLVGQQNFLAQAEGDIALGLIGVYRAVGGGWEYRTSATIGPMLGAPIAADAPFGKLP